MIRLYVELSDVQLGWGRMYWDVEGSAEVDYRVDNVALLVRIGPRYLRSEEMNTLLGDRSKACDNLNGRQPHSLEEQEAEMEKADRIGKMPIKKLPDPAPDSACARCRRYPSRAHSPGNCQIELTSSASMNVLSL